MKKRVCIIEDNKLYQQALIDVINECDEFELDQVYSSAEVAIEILNNTPDIAIIDIQLPGMSGIEFMSQVQPQTSIQFLVCSMHDDDEHIVKALESGAAGYILKDASVQQIKNALLELVQGGAPMSPFIAKRVFSFFHKPKGKNEAYDLSDREREVLEHMSQGLLYKEIAENLGISAETVKKHIRNIYQKLHVQNKVEAINKYRRL